MEEQGYETTSLDPCVYIWDYPDNCVLSVLRTEDGNMVKQGIKYYIISGPDSATNLVFEVKNNLQEHCGKPRDIYPTNYDSLYVANISGVFDLRSERNVDRERNGATQLLQYIAATYNNEFAQLYAYVPKHTPHKTSDEDINMNMEYEMHIGTIFDYIFFQSSLLLHASEIQLSKNPCEQERTQIFTILMLSLENPRLAVYMLTGNGSMFLETDGNLAWLSHCPLVYSLLHAVNQCYDRIPILYEGKIQFVDPIKRKTNPAAKLQNCTDRIKNLLQFDMDKKTRGIH